MNNIRHTGFCSVFALLLIFVSYSPAASDDDNWSWDHIDGFKSNSPAASDDDNWSWDHIDGFKSNKQRQPIQVKRTMRAIVIDYCQRVARHKAGSPANLSFRPGGQFTNLGHGWYHYAAEYEIVKPTRRGTRTTTHTFSCKALNQGNPNSIKNWKVETTIGHGGLLAR